MLIFSGLKKRTNWELHDPENDTGTEEEKYQMATERRNEIERRIDELVKSESQKED